MLKIICYFIGHRMQAMAPCDQCFGVSEECRICGLIKGACEPWCLPKRVDKMMHKAYTQLAERVDEELNDMLDIDDEPDEF